VASTDLFYEDTKLPATTSSTGYGSDQESGLLINDTSIYELETPQLNNRVTLCSISDGWKSLDLKRRWGRAPTTVLSNCRLNCEVCNGFCGTSGAASLTIPNEDTLHRLTVSEDWFSTDFIAGIVLLATHDAHLSSKLPPMDHKVMPVFTPYPNAHVSKILSYGDSTHFVSVVYNRLHFAVLYYDIAGRTVTVYDGLNYDVDAWGPHVVHTILTYGLASVQEYTKVIDKNEHTDDFGRKHKETKLTLQYGGYQGSPSTVWTVTNNTTYVQKDDHNCGPIACMKLLEIHGLIAAGSIDRIGLGQSLDTYRSVVIKYFKDSVVKYDGVLKVELRNRIAHAIASYAVDRTSDAISSHPTDLTVNANSTSPSTDDGLSTASANRTRAMAMKNSKQEQSAIKEMKRCAKNAIDLGATVGAVVTLQVDYRTNSHAEGLVAIVYDVNMQTGGILVCCDRGVITHSGDKRKYWVPVDKYKVRAKHNESCALLKAMEDIRNLVLLGKYNPNPQPRISYSKLHAACVDATSPTRRTKGCSCKNGNCKNTCGCKKNNVKCHSGCRCNGNCFNGNCISPMKVPASDKFG
jgi:hypothetical protein